ncbi:MAG: hypothetical protein GY884_13730 [Proteobacteria bacterium]|nr:hypothetical protein [Pseudomonadota bacterium]
MGEQGFAMQHHALLDSALVSPNAGLVVGASLATFPIGPPEENLSGKEENTAFSPVFPRLQVAYVGEDWSVGVAGLPLIPVSGASAWTVALSGSLTKPVGVFTAGLEADLSTLVAHAPITASAEQLDQRDQLDNPGNVDPSVADENCGADGCIDTFRMVNPSVRVGLSRDLGRFTPYGKVGVTYVNERLEVEYDGTSWHLQVPQASAHLGSSLALGERWLLAAGASAALKTKATHRGQGGPVFFKFEGAAAVRF